MEELLILLYKIFEDDLLLKSFEICFPNWYSENDYWEDLYFDIYYSGIYPNNKQHIHISQYRACRLIYIFSFNTNFRICDEIKRKYKQLGGKNLDLLLNPDI